MDETKPYITCRQLIDFIGAYLDETLDEAAREDFERHLTRCPSCRNYLETYQKTTALLRLASEEPLGDVPEDLVRTILSRR